jgi:hypothetical protein
VLLVLTRLANDQGDVTLGTPPVEYQALAQFLDDALVAA